MREERRDVAVGPDAQERDVEDRMRQPVDTVLRQLRGVHRRRLDPDELYGEVITSGLALLGDAEPKESMHDQ